MGAKISTSILTPDETDAGVWVAVVEDWHIRTDNQLHAERIIDACGMTTAIGRRDAQVELQIALG